MNSAMTTERVIRLSGKEEWVIQCFQACIDDPSFSMNGGVIRLHSGLDEELAPILQNERLSPRQH